MKIETSTSYSFPIPGGKVLTLTDKDAAEWLLTLAERARTNFPDAVRLGERFAGVSVEYRKRADTWPKPWRVTVIADKNERGVYRIVAWGDTAEAAIATAVQQAEWHDGVARADYPEANA
jgi:hypothetical protein